MTIVFLPIAQLFFLNKSQDFSVLNKRRANMNRETVIRKERKMKELLNKADTLLILDENQKKIGITKTNCYETTILLLPF